MARKKRPVAYRQTKQYVDLVHVPDVSATSDAYNRSVEDTRIYKGTEKVDPPFRGEGGERFISRQEFGLTYKVIAIIGFIVLSIVAPVIWFASRLNSRVEVVQEDVKALKGKTEVLNERTIAQGLKMDTLQKLISEFLGATSQDHPPVRVQSQKPTKRLQADGLQP